MVRKRVKERMCIECRKVFPFDEFRQGSRAMGAGNAYCRICAVASVRCCRSCGEPKDILHFHQDKGAPGGRKTRCRACIHKKFYAPHAERRAAGMRRYVYGISNEQFEQLMERQGGNCAICSMTFAFRHGKIYTPAVDHDHRTGRIRGLLCHKCNLGIGHLLDSAEITARAASYLRCA